MASSGKRRQTADPLERALLTAVQLAVDEVRFGAAPETPATRARGRTRSEPPLLVAYSGGRDSTALLSIVRQLREARASGFSRPHAVHVHHGLQREADSWVQHCERLCAQMDVPLTVRRVRVERRGTGVEAAAREARYRVLEEVARELGAQIVLTAHHLDDRLETFLLQWIRGAGPEGLSGMARQREFDGAGAGIALLRPLLEVPRERIEEYVARKELAFVDDPSNSDQRLERNAVRLRVVPELARLRTGFRTAAARSIELLAEAAEVLRSVAREDLQVCARDAPASMLRIDRLAALPQARRVLVVREWLAQAGLPSPPRARLREALQQALHAGADARLLVRLGDRELRRHRGLLCLNAPRPNAPAQQSVQWHGEEQLAVPGWGGTLVFTPTDGEGFDSGWLGAEPLQLRSRTGGERFKPHPTRPSKRLKQIFQEARIPEYRRPSLPLLWRDGRLIYVAGVGPDVRLLVNEGERVRIDWVGAAPLSL
ncbi:MAG: tRNA lysidine(34) synthetase TilS [Burkholderiaceae bacterium]|nr:tRNA lysidine(34) synthetase TilS [Burkholderiaceae bacterium]